MKSLLSPLGALVLHVANAAHEIRHFSLAPRSRSVPAGTLQYDCNICGTSNAMDLCGIDRERRSCLGCGSSLRQRALIAALSRILITHQSLRMDEWRGVDTVAVTGISDVPLIERALRQKTSYRNTFLHRAPVLDICAPGEADVASCDVLVCSDVLEHVTPPVARAFHGMMRILRPGGHVLLTVPCTASEATTEHYPNLFDYRIVERNGKTTLVNRTRDGHVEEFQDLVFHGGPGETLEMRHFAMNDLEKQLLDAGFSEVQIFAQADFRHGVYWAAPYPVPVVAQAGRQRGRQSVRHTATTNGLPSGNR